LLNGPDKDSYFHPFFRRGHEDLLLKIKRSPGRGKTIKIPQYEDMFLEILNATKIVEQEPVPVADKPARPRSMPISRTGEIVFCKNEKQYRLMEKTASFENLHQAKKHCPFPTLSSSPSAPSDLCLMSTKASSSVCNPFSLQQLDNRFVEMIPSCRGISFETSPRMEYERDIFDESCLQMLIEVLSDENLN
jgi:hypothetical protein